MPSKTRSSLIVPLNFICDSWQAFIDLQDVGLHGSLHSDYICLALMPSTSFWGNDMLVSMSWPSLVNVSKQELVWSFAQTFRILLLLSHLTCISRNQIFLWFLGPIFWWLAVTAWLWWLLLGLAWWPAAAMLMSIVGPLWRCENTHTTHRTHWEYTQNECRKHTGCTRGCSLECEHWGFDLLVSGRRLRVLKTQTNRLRDQQTEG